MRKNHVRLSPRPTYYDVKKELLEIFEKKNPNNKDMLCNNKPQIINGFMMGSNIYDSKTNTTPFKVEIEINGNRVKALIDTGADISIINKKDLPHYIPIYKEQNKII
ncbi:hypothetical protein COBT_004170, partial [Conglomerata obtusa]